MAIKYVADTDLNWQRKGSGKGFHYLNKNGQPLRTAIKRIEKLAIPPAWTAVRICPDEKGHIQAVGLDAKGRKQYIYHPDWVAHNQKHKFDQMVRFGEILPTLRQTVAGHMRQRQLNKQRILATVVWLLEHSFIRVGNKTYEKENQSYGLTTLRNKHVAVRGDKIKFSFKGKSGVYHELDISHPRVAQTIKECIELPGYEIFQYLDEEQQRQRVDSRDVNEYLQELTGEALSAKDFRTWGGTTLAGDLFYSLDQENREKEAQQVISEVVEQVADHLGNTTQVCRKYYIHPKIITSYETGKLQPHFKKVYARRKPNGLSLSEKATWLLLTN